MADETPFHEQVRAWSNLDLLDVARHIDKDAHPERNRIVQEEIERRKDLPPPDIVPPPPRPSPSKYATFWRRVGAILLDGLIFLPVASGALFLAHASSDPMSQSAPGLIASLLYCLYSIILHGRNGQTVGKLATGVRVLDLAEERLTVAQAITRDLVPLSLSIASFVVIVNVGLPAGLSGVGSASLMPGLDFARLTPGLALLAINFIWGLLEILTMTTNRRRRAVHDLIAGSVVVRVGASDAPQSAAEAGE